MPKRYEDEIRDILKGLDGFPGDSRPRRRWSRPSFTGFHLPRLGQLDARRVMGGALILMLFAWILRGPWTSGYSWLVVTAGYISLASIVLFIVALVMLVRGGSFGSGRLNREQRWRGQVINLPRRTGPLGSLRLWWRQFSSRFSRNQPRRPGPRGRDSLQW